MEGSAALKAFVPKLFSIARRNQVLLGILALGLLIRLPDWRDGMHLIFGGDDHTYSLLAGKLLLGDYKLPFGHPYVQVAAARYTFIFTISLFYALFGVGDLAHGLYQ